MEGMEKKLGRSGQAGIEFMGVMVVIFFFLFFFMSLAITLIVSDYVEYATFMAARTFKAGASTRAKQEEHAQIVFDTYFKKVQGIARNPSVSFLAANADDQQTQGMLVNYTVDLFYMPPVFILQGAPASTMNLNAEAHLGRDPSFEDCIGFFEEFGQKTLQIQNGNLIDQLEDNGC